MTFTVGAPVGPKVTWAAVGVQVGTFVGALLEGAFEFVGAALGVNVSK